MTRLPRAVHVRGFAVHMCFAAAVALAFFPGIDAQLLLQEGVLIVAAGPSVFAGILAAIPRRYALPYAVALFIGDVWLGLHLNAEVTTSLLRASVDTCAYLLLAEFLRRRRSFSLHTLRDAGALLWAAAAVAGIRMLSLLLAGQFGEQQPAALGLLAVSLGFGAFAGVIIFLPLATLIVGDPLGRRRLLERPGRTLVVALGVAGVVLAAFGTISLQAPHGAQYFVLPFLLYAAVALPQITVAVFVAFITIAVGAATVHGYGPFGGAYPVVGDAAVPALESLLVRAIDAQTFLIALPLTLWFIGAAISETRRTHQALVVQVATTEDARLSAVAAEERFRAAFQHSPVPMSYSAIDTEQAWSPGDTNDAMREFTGYTRDELGGLHWTDLTHPDDRARAVANHEAFVSGETAAYQSMHRFIRKDGSLRTGLLSVAGVRDLPGAQLFAVAQIVDVTETIAAREDLQRMVDTDPFTGLHSRPWMTSRLAAALERAEASGHSAAVMVVDVTRFHVVRRTYGFVAGDEVLQVLAERVERAVRSAHAVVGRFDGERFVVLFEQAPSESQLAAIAEDIVAAVSQELTIRGTRVSRSASIGIAISTPSVTAESLILEAEGAAALADVDPEADWFLAGSTSAAGAQEYLQIEDEIRRGIERNEFTVYYQPQVRLSDGMVCGHEALVRWHHATRGVLSPVAFMDVAEDSKLIVAIGRKVLDDACATVAKHPEVGPISVNVSAVQLLEPGWFASVVDTLEAHRVSPQAIVLELTETVALRMTAGARRALEALRRMGMGLHLDDFGTGFSSVSVLNDLPVTGMKLDRSFVTGIGSGSGEQRALITGLAGLAHGLQLELVSEGVESPEDALALVECGCTLAQGYYFGRPQAEPLGMQVA